MRLRFPVGTILLVRQVVDMQGEKPKDRNVVLVSPLDCESEDEKELLGLAITGQFDSPVAAPCVELEFGRHGRCVTGLVKPSVAHCEWYVAKPVADIIRRAGYVGDTVLRDIMAILTERFGKK